MILLGAGSDMATSQENPELREFLRVTRIVTLVWLLIAAVVALIEILSFVVSLLHLSFPGGAILGFVYAALWGFTDLMILGRFDDWSTLAQKGDYAELQRSLLLWVVLGVLFGLVPGLLLGIIYVRLGGPQGGGLYWSRPASPAQEPKGNPPHQPTGTSTGSQLQPPPPYSPP